MAFAILRVEKLKTHQNIAGSLAHNYRTRETPNADDERAHLNQHDLPSVEHVKAAIKTRIPEKHRKDAVLCLEYFIGASPEYFTDGQDKDGSKYFASALDWLKQRHGSENVISTTIHRDETSPHLVAYVVPNDENNKLNAKKFVGGKLTLSNMQTDFAKSVAHHGLKRGIQGSKAEHKTIQKYYAELNSSISENDLNPKIITTADLKPIKKSLLFAESDTDIAHRLNQKITSQVSPILEVGNKASRTLQEAKAIRNSVADQQSRLEAIVEALAPLNSEERHRLVQRVCEMSKEMLEERRQKQIDRLNEESREKQRKREQKKSQGR